MYGQLCADADSQEPEAGADTAIQLSLHGDGLIQFLGSETGEK